jgi:hypothetical protein
MNRLEALGIIDIRQRLPRVAGRAERNPARTSITYHYNGGAVALHNNPGATTDQWISHLIGIATYHLTKNWGKPEKIIRGHGIMYHFAILPSGQIVQMRDLDECLWHCANAEGNDSGFAFHFPMGGDQAPTVRQWASAGALSLALMQLYPHINPTRVFGHTEWPKYAERADGSLYRVPNSACPGTIIMPMIRAWRDGGYKQEPAIGATVKLKPIRFLKTVYTTNVRTKPGKDGDVVMIMPKGEVFGFDDETPGQPILGDSIWMHRADGLGFVSRTCLEAA